jgi:hypothetical protein
VPAEFWSKAEDGVWSPAHITKHVVLAYEILLSELNGGPGMSVRTKFLQRTFLRLFMVPGLLKGKPFPKGARAPKETRPVMIVENQSDAILEFDRVSVQFEQSLRDAYERNRRSLLTHAYFGRADLRRSLQLCARHVLHHAKTIAAADQSISPQL